MRIRCPSCHAEHALDQAFEDEAARELMGVLADLPRECSRPLVAYLGLWRSRTRALAWERALRIAREALALHADREILGAALSEAVEGLRRKQDDGAWKPLTGHNYLKRVLESTSARPSQALVERPARQQRNVVDHTASRIAAVYEGLGDD